MVCERSDVFASSCAIARAFPIFTRRSNSARRADKKLVTVEFVIVGGDSSPLNVSELEVLNCDTFFIHKQPVSIRNTDCIRSSSSQCLSNAADGVRLAARIVDTPCNEMNTDHFLVVSE